MANFNEQVSAHQRPDLINENDTAAYILQPTEESSKKTLPVEEKKPNQETSVATNASARVSSFETQSKPDLHLPHIKGSVLCSKQNTSM